MINSDDYDARQGMSWSRVLKTEKHLGDRFTDKQRTQLMASFDVTFLEGVNQGEREKAAEIRVALGLKRAGDTTWQQQHS